MIREYKIRRKRIPTLQPNGKVKRDGRVYYEVAYFTDFWHYKEFDSLKEAKEFVNA